MIYDVQIIENHTVICYFFGFLFHFCDKGFSVGFCLVMFFSSIISIYPGCNVLIRD
jgi:hypothetical protein